MSLGKGKSLVLGIPVVLALLGGIAAFSPITHSGVEGVVAEGVQVANLSVGGNSYPFLQQRVRLLADQCLNQQVYFVYGSLRRSATFRDLGFAVDVEAIINKAWLVGRQGSVFKRLVDRYRCYNQGVRITMRPVYNQVLVTNNLQKLLGELDYPAQDAKWIPSADQIKVQPAVMGQRVDYEKLVDLLQSKFSSLPSPGIGPTTCIVPVEKTKPEMDTGLVQAMKVEGLRASCTTYFDPNNRPRADNIKLACRQLDGLLLAPGQGFSFNQAVGPRTEEAGYQEAIVIEENEFTPGIGGGVCQVSSTLYNAVLRSDLKILERSHHSRVVNYMDPGLDAAVAYGTIDLRFQNNSGGYLFIAATCGDGFMAISIYGKITDMPKVDLVRKVEKVIEPPETRKVDPSLLPGQAFVAEEGSKGFLVTVERVKRDQKEKTTAREFISRDLYPARPRVVLVAP